MTRSNLRKTDDALPCTCSHSAREHNFTRKSPGCTNCNCIAYRTFEPTPLHRGNAEELAHWSHHIGLPPNTPQMTPEQCNAAYRREQYRNRRELIVREIEQLEREANSLRGELDTFMRSTKRTLQQTRLNLDRKYAELAAIPDITHPPIGEVEVAA